MTTSTSHSRISSAYGAYKDSSVEWLGAIPEHWEVKRLKFLTSIRSGEDSKFEDGGYPLFGANGVIGRTATATFSNARILIGRVGSSGAINLAEGAFGVSDNCLILDMPKAIDTYFLYYASLILDFTPDISKNAQPLVTATNVGVKVVAVPPLEEQHAITAFLGREIVRIDELIKKKQRQIELLQEKRTALINHAVTKGLNPDVKMKSSGIEWLGEIPEHWATCKIKHITTIRGRIGYRGYATSDLVAPGEGALTIGGKHINSKNRLDLSDPEFLSWEKYYESPEIQLKSGDIVLVQRGSLGKVAFIESEIGHATINPSMILLNNIAIGGEYLYWLLSSEVIQNQVQHASSTTAVPMISQEQLGQMSIAIPPACEQSQILRYLSKSTIRIDGIQNMICLSIEKLQEYRMALISAAVTGKIDVRGEVA